MTDAQNGNGQALAETNADSGVELKEELQHRKYRATDLPLTAAQRQSIDSLLYRFKKGGDFDHVRKRIWADFSESEAKEAFTKLLLEKAEAEIDREPSLLSRERGKAATLIEGAIDRSDFYKSIEDTLDNFTSRHLESILQDLRGIRRTEVGDEQALAEEERGKKSDEEYKSVVEAKRREREIAHLRELEARKQKEIEEAKKEAEEAERRRELKRKKAEEERRLRDEREERRRAERDQLREEQRRYDDDRERDREERYERRRREDSYYRDDRDRRRSRSRALPPGDRWEPGMDRNRGVKSSAPVLDDKSLEDAALELLLKEGKELAEKSRVRPEFDFERVDPDNAHKAEATAEIETTLTGTTGETALALSQDASTRDTTTTIEEVWTGRKLIYIDLGKGPDQEHLLGGGEVGVAPRNMNAYVIPNVAHPMLRLEEVTRPMPLKSLMKKERAVR
ncbi:hypothetical protein KEM55_000790 [Ascosphaera atra]|nr:hypothetical protein KEM55_000790 [Ascosphaera atra]